MIKPVTPGLSFVVINVLLLPPLVAFQSSTAVTFLSQKPTYINSLTATRLCDSATTFEVELDMPPSNSGNKARLKFSSVLSVPSEIVEVRYQLPFGLDVAPIKNLAMCTKDGTGGGTCRRGRDSTSKIFVNIPSHVHELPLFHGRKGW
jgi:hypothetical protein